MGVHHVTHGQFAAFIEETMEKTDAEKGAGTFVHAGEKWHPDVAVNWRSPGFEQNSDHPVLCLSWIDSVKFAKWLTEKDDRPIRLPTEAEWEYSCRAGTASPFFFGNTVSTDQANYRGNESFGRGQKEVFRKKTTSIGRFPSNDFGLYDMHGNAWEWCQDWLGDYSPDDVVDPQGPDSGTFRVLRGGSWRNTFLECRSAQRNALAPSVCTYGCGLRVCFSLD